jgi:hypothetical protein
MLDRYRQSLGKRAEQTMAEILDAEFNLVPDQTGENELPQIGPSSNPPVAARAEHDGGADLGAGLEHNPPDAVTESVVGEEDLGEDQDGAPA